MLTTNGLLLNDANIKFLAENEIGLAISIDGPQKEHDRLRVKIDGSGSFEQIANNIKNSTLEIIKGEKHGSYIIHSDKIYKIIKKYLED